MLAWALFFDFYNNVALHCFGHSLALEVTVRLYDEQAG